MFYTKNVVGITKYLLLSVLTLSSECLAAARVQISNSSEEVVSNTSSRRLLYSWDHDNSGSFRYSHYDNTTEKVTYVILSIVIFVIALLCKCCAKYGCEDGEAQNCHQGTVVHPPPRISGVVVPPPSRYGSGPGLHSSSGSAIAPPSTNSRSIILPYEGISADFPAHLYGFDNPNYQATNSSSEQLQNFVSIPVSSVNRNQTPLCEVMDLPPSYDTVVKEDLKYPKPTGNR